MGSDVLKASQTQVMKILRITSFQKKRKVDIHHSMVLTKVH